MAASPAPRTPHGITVANAVVSDTCTGGRSLSAE
ncbi:hypothetical protein PPTG_21372 [Phytophthora nicotianae INRA-310]|uniref:Uncharacterized protein n=3 Tax=Phytophthora nicotianae TaxID=4792 RepID=W2R5X7_PHYN3|nr:hypothetical protein PPTG_21372 [Phytophthora nicotianae INRA-310]ETI40937.1 hypothetical protein F443_13775 [Phytophthora nicotianae P1569]ETM40962.1 hypothetical protein L914_13223 [Phytophthora nicotianae]ETN20777.1 hypothetical protein PPTG_21372 [Phytophthora nicotianae INRA-310]